MQSQPSRPPEAIEFATFMRAYQDMVFSTAARLAGNDAQAQDISQAVFLKAYEHFDELRGSERAGGWLKTVATRLTLNYLRRYRARWRFFSELRRQGSEEPDDGPAIDDFPAPETLLGDLDARQRSAILERNLASLPDHQRVPLVLYHFEDMPYEVIATELGIPLSKVRSDIHRGRRALAVALTRSGMTGVAHDEIA